MPRITPPALFLVLVASANGQPIYWDNPDGGRWNNLNNWSPMITPTLPTHQAIFNLPGSYIVELDTNLSSMGLIALENPSAELHIQSSRSLQLNQGIHNNGQVIINPFSTGSQTSIVYKNTAPLSGSGTLQLAATGPFPQLLTDPSAIINHEQHHTITGSGIVSAQINNSGTISATGVGGPLELIDSVINQSATGTLTSQSMNDSIRIQNTAVSGGTIDARFSNSVRVMGDSRIADTQINGILTIEPGAESLFAGRIVNTGTIEINPNKISERTYILCYEDAEFVDEGHIFMAASSPYAQIATFDDAILTLGPDQRITGEGSITASITNHGEIIADVKDSVLGLSRGLENRSIFNSGRIASENNSRINFLALSITQSHTGVIDSDSGIATYNSSKVIGGKLTGFRGRHIFIGSQSELIAVTNEATIELIDRNPLRITDSILNNTEIIVNPFRQFGETRIIFTNDGAFNGNGFVLLNFAGVHAQITSENNAVITNGPDHTIEGSGRIEAPFINKGFINAGAGTTVLSIESSTVENQSHIRADNFGTLKITDTSIKQAPDAKLSARQSAIIIENSSILGGLIETESSTPPGRLIIRESSAIGELQSDATIIVDANQSLMITPPLINNGLITLNPDLPTAPAQIILTETLQLNGTGVLQLNTPLDSPAVTDTSGNTELYNSTNHSIIGSGSIGVPITNAGLLAPGNDGENTIGTLSLLQDAKFNTTATLSVQIAGSDSADTIKSHGQVFLGGTLDVTFTNGFDPAASSQTWSATILESTQPLVGTFDAVNAPPTGDPDLVFEVIYEELSVRVGAFSRSDINRSGHTDFYDISEFLALFELSSPSIDINQDGQVDFFDLSAFISEYINSQQ